MKLIIEGTPQEIKSVIDKIEPQQNNTCMTEAIMKAYKETIERINKQTQQEVRKHQHFYIWRD